MACAYFAGQAESGRAGVGPGARVTLRSGGVSRVVIMTMITIDAKTESLTTPKPLPIPAKINPTSPRGIIPTPIAMRLRPRPAAYPETTFPTIAAAVSAAARKTTDKLLKD